MNYEWTLNTCSLSIKFKAGTLSSGADSVTTLTLGGASMKADAETLLEVSDAIATVVTTPVLETLRVDNYIAEAVEA